MEPLELTHLPKPINSRSALLLDYRDVLVIELTLEFLDDEIARCIRHTDILPHSEVDVQRLRTWFHSPLSKIALLWNQGIEMPWRAMPMRDASLLAMAIEAGVTSDFLDYWVLEQASRDQDIWQVAQQDQESVATFDFSACVKKLEERYFPALYFKQATLKRLLKYFHQHPWRVFKTNRDHD